MKYQFFALLFILSLTVSFFETETSFRFYSSTEVSKSKLKKEIIAQMERVDELRVMKELAAELGIKQVYLFGGSAAAWAHYVYWDLEREAGMGDYDKSRFDYDYTSIFRSNQDMDIVVDVDSSNQHLVSEFERKLQARFAHFQGNKSAWEVRPLRFDFGTKEKILGNLDFLNQNSDSHSTGLISVTDNDEVGIRDFKDWENKDNHFFDDVYNRELHYYRDQSKHKATKRFKEGMNPEIFSAIRYLTKAFQYELEIDAESLKQLKEVLAQFDANKDLEQGYTKTWIEKNAIKLYQNAIDLEFAYETMNDLKLQELLISINNNINEISSMAWWMNRMPLLSREFGDSSKGKTAGELGIDIVAHETNNFTAYESITKSHSGKANVFISRSDAIGEAAGLGDGFYTRIGRKGARGTGLTIRFKVNRNAVEGIDFKRFNDFIVIRNKVIIEVIPESLEISPVDYFRKLANNELIFDHSDKGVQEKVKRKISLKLDSLTDNEHDEIIKIVEKHAHNFTGVAVDTLLSEWFSLKLSVKYPKILNILLEKEKPNPLEGYILREILSQEHWANNDNGIKYIEMFMDNHKYDSDIARNILSKKHWFQHEKSIQLLNKLIERGNAIAEISSYVFSQKRWGEHEESFDLLMKFIKSFPEGNNQGYYALGLPHWANHKKSNEILDYFLKQEKVEGALVSRLLSLEEWATHQKGPELLERILKDDNFEELSAAYTLNESYWVSHKRGAEFLEKLILKSKEWDTHYDIAANTLSREDWAKHIKGADLVEKLIRKKIMNTYIFEDLISSKVWANNDRIVNVLKKLIEEDSTYDSSIVLYVLSKEHWANHPRGFELLERLIKKGNLDNLIAEYIFSKPFWAKDKRGAKLLEKLVRNGNAYNDITVYALSKDFWQNHPYFVKKFSGKKVTVDNIESSFSGLRGCLYQLKSIL